MENKDVLSGLSVDKILADVKEKKGEKLHLWSMDEIDKLKSMQKAAELLKEGKSVAEVAEETGFVNAKYFSSLFKKQFGMQPSKYSEKF